MSKDQSLSDKIGQGFVGFLLLIFLLAWLTIPNEPQKVDGFQV